MARFHPSVGHEVNRARRRALARCGCRVAAALLGLAMVAPALRAQAGPMADPAPGLVETGVPPFVVLGPEALGLASPPVDLQVLPDGRMLAVGRGELAVGDGTRWEVRRQADGDGAVYTESVLVDEAGRIYAGVPGGFARIEMLPGERWRFQRVADLPAAAGLEAGGPIGGQEVQGRWFWWSGSGPVIAWRPGTPAHVVGRVNAIERAFVLDGAVHLSDTSTGELQRFDGETFHRVPQPPTNFVEQTITCTIPLGDGAVLAGTNRAGLFVHEAGAMRPFARGGLLGGDHRINDLCVTEPGLFAAAIDNVGIVFFDRQARVVQVLDRSVDHRLARVRRLLWTPGGGLWGLLNDGVVRVAFPDRVSNFEPLVPTGLAFALPFRHDGRLWLMSDGRAERGVYDADGRLTHFEVDSPEPYVSSLNTLDGEWLASTREGIYRRTDAGGWERVVDGLSSAKIRPEAVEPGRWLYVAEGEVGWLRHRDGRFFAERFPLPELGHAYSTQADGHGALWAELGTGRVARIEPTLPRPTVRIYGEADGLPNGWLQIFVLDGEARVNLPYRIFRLDPARDRFVPDTDLLRQRPALRGALGRPILDAAGRLWVAHESQVQVVAARDGRDVDAGETMPDGLAPIYFTGQPDGVVWMHQRGRLARFDPALPAPRPPRLRALITRVQFPSTNREQSATGGELTPLAAGDNSLVVHFLAPGAPVGRPVTFDVLLEGAGGGWFSTGTAGSVSFNHLGRGRYALRVRPRLGSQLGAEARLAFTVLAPWYRTPVAYASYGAGGIALIVFVGWLSAYFQRREKARLERIVAARTRELHQANEELGRQIQASLEKTDALKISEDRYRRLSENAPDIIFRLRAGPPVAYDYVSPAIERITGYAPAEFYADATLARRIVEPPGDASIEILERKGAVPSAVHEIQLRARDGRIVILEERLAVVRDRDGRLVAVEGIARDITRRKAAEAEIRRLSEAVAQSPVAVFITDPAGAIVFANPRLGEMTGYTDEHLAGLTFHDLRADLIEPALFAELWATVSRGEPWRGELALRRREGGTVHVRAAISPLRGPDGGVVNQLGLVEDITEWLDEQARRRRLEAQLFQAQKLESIGTLAGGIAHDFNNILTGILGYCELATLAAPADPELRGDLAEIRAGGLRAKDLVKQILTFSRRAESKLSAADLAEIVDEALKLIRASAPATIELVRDFEPGLIRADATQIHQIVLNLCTNCLHAMRDRPGRLSVGVHRVAVDAALAAEVAELRPGDCMRLTVEDTGCGMDEATMARIFDPFFTTKQPGEGTGLGLAIVRGIVAGHQGAMRVQSRLGGGTTFEIYFPIADRVETLPVPVPGIPRGDGCEVLLVDDEPAVVKFAAVRLRQFGYATTVFHDPREALGAIRAAPERFGVIVTDLTMPHLTGIELLQQARASGRLVPAVIVSGYVKELAQITPDKLPRSTVLTKPFSGEELAQAIAAVRGATRAGEA